MVTTFYCHRRWSWGVLASILLIAFSSPPTTTVRAVTCDFGRAPLWVYRLKVYYDVRKSLPPLTVESVVHQNVVDPRYFPTISELVDHSREVVTPDFERICAAQEDRFLDPQTFGTHECIRELDSQMVRVYLEGCAGFDRADDDAWANVSALEATSLIFWLRFDAAGVIPLLQISAPILELNPGIDFPAPLDFVNWMRSTFQPQFAELCASREHAFLNTTAWGVIHCTFDLERQLAVNIGSTYGVDDLWMSFLGIIYSGQLDSKLMSPEVRGAETWTVDTLKLHSKAYSALEFYLHLDPIGLAPAVRVTAPLGHVHSENFASPRAFITHMRWHFHPQFQNMCSSLAVRFQDTSSWGVDECTLDLERQLALILGAEHAIDKLWLALLVADYGFLLEYAGDDFKSVSPSADPLAFFINLEHRHDRRAAIEMELAFLPYEIRQLRARYNPSDGHLGCGLSHVAALRTARMDGVKSPFFVVFEDDFEWRDGPEKGAAQLQAAIASAEERLLVRGKPWNVLLFAGRFTNEHGGIVDATDSLFVGASGGSSSLLDLRDELGLLSQTASGYVVRAEYVDTLLATWGVAMRARVAGDRSQATSIDQAWKALQREQSGWLCTVPFLGRQRAGFSNIEGATLDHRV